MQLIQYLNEHYLTREELLAACCIDAARLEELQRREVMPQPSYRLKLDIGCESVFGAHGEQAELAYYAKGYASWLGMLSVANTDAFRVFSQRYRAQLAQRLAGGFATTHVKITTGLDTHIIDEWQHFLAGTYGLCTRSGLPEDIADKELAVLIIEEIIANRTEPALPDADYARLEATVDLLDQACSAYAPHERTRSVRHRLVDGVRKTFLRK
jgi:hypothetical protein